MNAYELADYIKENYASQNNDIEKLALMLRQQADRIAELEKDLALKTRDRDVFCDFTLAYEKRIEELEKLEQDFIRVIKQTNPNKSHKELSDEEIIIIRQNTKPSSADNWADTLSFARAIIKASRGEE